MRSDEFIRKLIAIANDYKTLYVNGTWGWPLTAANKARACKDNRYNIGHKAEIYAASADTFGFDCCGLIKGIIWGWYGNPNKQYGGAWYAINGLPDISETGMAEACTDKSSDFTKIVPASAVWMKGHIGVYIGDGHVVEATAAWEGKVVISDIGPNGERSRNGIRSGTWAQHGKMPWIEYEEEGETNMNVTYQVYAGKWLPNVTDREDFAGNLGKAISAVFAKLSGGDIFYRVHTKGGKWLPEVKNRSDYAGNLGQPIDAIMARSDSAVIHVQAHLLGADWLDAVTGYDERDPLNGYAGILGREIDAIYLWAEELPQDEPKPTEPTNPTPGEDKPVEGEKTALLDELATMADRIKKISDELREEDKK